MTIRGLIAASVAICTLAACTHTPNQQPNAAAWPQKINSARNVAQTTDTKLAEQLPLVNLADVASANSGYWSVTKGSGKEKVDFFGRYRAYIVSQPDQDYNDLYVFAETDALENLPSFKNIKVNKDGKLPKPEKDSEYKLIAKNSSFVWGGSWGGTEPTLTTNKKGSLVIQSMNEGIGRSSWNEQVIARFNPETAKVEVIGYEYQSYDKIDGSGLNCSFNFNTGVGLVTTTPIQVSENGVEKKPLPKPVQKKVSVPRKTVELSQWKSSPDNKSMSPCSDNIH